MHVPLLIAAIVAMATWLSAARSCSRNASAPSTPPDVAAPLNKSPRYYPAADDKTLLIAGVIEAYGQQAKSLESYYGGDYRLVSDDPALTRGMTARFLRITPAFPRLDDFKRYTGKQVIVRCRRAGFVRVKLDPMEQHPVMFGGEDENVGTFGGGLLVDEITIVSKPEPQSFPAVSEKEIVLTGWVRHHGWSSKSCTCAKAGDTDYYIINCDDLPLNVCKDLGLRYASANLVLRTTPAFSSIDDFLPFADRRVEIRGRRAVEISMTPEPGSPHFACRDENGQFIRGGGILVDRMTVHHAVPPVWR